MDFLGTLASLWDPASALIVLGGSLFATALRAGVSDLRATAASLASMGAKRFDYSAARAEIAAGVEDIRTHGVLRAQPSNSTDPEIADATGALIHTRSLQAAMIEHERHKRLRGAQADQAQRTIYAAAELAPIFGLAGTLLALSQLPAAGPDVANLSGAVGMAVLSTLYGLMAAHLVLLPLARWLERSAQKEEEDRQHLFDWLGEQLADACPSRSGPSSTQQARP